MFLSFSCLIGETSGGNLAMNLQNKETQQDSIGYLFLLRFTFLPRSLLGRTAHLIACRTTSSSENAIRSGRWLPSLPFSDTAAIFRKSTPSGVLSTPSMRAPFRAISLCSRRALFIAPCVTQQARGVRPCDAFVCEMGYVCLPRTYLASAPGVQGSLWASHSEFERTPK